MISQIIYTSRTPYQAYGRCKRLRWLSTHEGGGEEGKVGGLEPKRKSIHLVVGSAVHAGTEVLLREGQEALEIVDGIDLAEKLHCLFDYKVDDGGPTAARMIEDRAVVAALDDLAKEFGEGVEPDPDEVAGGAGGGGKQLDGGAGPVIDFAGLVPGQAVSSSGLDSMDSPIVITFDGMDFGGLVQQAGDANVGQEAQQQQSELGSGQMLSGLVGSGAGAASTYQSDSDYLREELSALVEGMVRAWARRKWKGLLEQFEVLEVEREGEWKLASWRNADRYHDFPSWADRSQIGRVKPPLGETCRACGEQCCITTVYYCPAKKETEIHFLSRHDGLLLERATGFLYLQSFKTTGSWDRRKELDAAVDMQGLSEAIDVEKRFAEAWEIIRAENSKISIVSHDAGSGIVLRTDRINELVSPRIAQWLATLPDSPRILGVRYEYLLKGSRKKDKKDAMNPDRYVQESVLCRAWKQEGITSDERRWAWTYDWQDETGKGRRLDYRSWQKAAVWKSMKIADWIDLLDQGKVQEGALNEQGEAMDALAGQFVPVLIQYRNRDETLDLLEQMEAQEVQIARDVEEVRRAEREEGYAGKRTALNRLFGQNRQACSYPGVCQYRTTATQAGFCFGAADPFHDPVVLERFQERRPNHPKEGLVQIDVSHN